MEAETVRANAPADAPVHALQNAMVKTLTAHVVPTAGNAIVAQVVDALLSYYSVL